MPKHVKKDQPKEGSAQLPGAPNFAKLDERALRSADERTRIMALIGHLSFAWSNNESMFIYVLMILLKADFKSAAIIFVTLNTTRARMDLVRRLTKAHVADPKIIRKVERMIERFGEATKLRNEFNHCIYTMDADGRITHTDVLRITESKTDVEYVKSRPLDEVRIREMSKAIRSLTLLNREVWNFLPVLREAVDGKENKG